MSRQPLTSFPQCVSERLVLDLWVRYLSGHLPDAVDELDEERRALRVGVVLVSVTDALQKQEAQV